MSYYYFSFFIDRKYCEIQWTTPKKDYKIDNLQTQVNVNVKEVTKMLLFHGEFIT